MTLGTPSLDFMVFVYHYRDAKLSNFFLRSGSADCRERDRDTASSHFSCELFLYVKTYYFQSSWFLTRPLGDVSGRQYLTLRHTARPHRLLSGPLSLDAENRLHGSRLLIQCFFVCRERPSLSSFPCARCRRRTLPWLEFVVSTGSLLWLTLRLCNSLSSMLTVRPPVSGPSSGSNIKGFIILLTAFVQQTDEWTLLGLECATTPPVRGDSARSHLMSAQLEWARSAR